MAQYRVPVLEKFEYQQAVISTISAPPALPVKGDRYIVGPSATGVFIGKEKQIAWYNGVAFMFDIPAAGWTVYNTGSSTQLQYTGSAWISSGEGTFEKLANKSIDTALGTSNILYPSQNAVKSYVDNAVVGLLDDRGSYAASSNVFPSSGGSGAAGAILKGDIWFVSVAGVLGGAAVNIGDSFRALIDSPGQTAANWSVLESNIGYVSENVANKDTDGTLAANSDTKYASQKAVKIYADTKATLAQVKADVDIADALSKKHTAGTDTVLDNGGVNQITAAQAKEAYTKRGVYDVDLEVILFDL